MPEKVMKTHRNFCKLAKDFGIKLCGDRNAKKWAVYGHDNEGFFYCDKFPKNYIGLSPTLHIERFKNHEWVACDEKSRTTEMIWECYVKNGKLKPMSYAQLDCAYNRRVKAAIENRKFKQDVHSPWRLQYGKHGSYCDGFANADMSRVVDDIIWKKENAGMIETVKKVGV